MKLRILLEQFKEPSPGHVLKKCFEKNRGGAGTWTFCDICWSSVVFGIWHSDQDVMFWSNPQGCVLTSRLRQCKLPSWFVNVSPESKCQEDVTETKTGEGHLVSWSSRLRFRKPNSSQFVVALWGHKLLPPYIRVIQEGWMRDLQRRAPLEITGPKINPFLIKTCLMDFVLVKSMQIVA